MGGIGECGITIRFDFVLRLVLFTMLGGKVILTGTQYCIMVAQSTEINLLLYAGLGLDVLTNWLIVATAGCYYC